MPLVEPLPLGADPEVAELAAFFNTTLGFLPNSVLTMQRRPEIARALRGRRRKSRRGASQRVCVGF